MKTFLTHLILIAIILITLFPLFWLVTASFRGDNAVFSSHILPQRWTLYNYKEILFPQKNVPLLLNDFNSAVYAIGSFNDKNVDYREKYITSNLPNFESLIHETTLYLNKLKGKDKVFKSNLKSEDFTNSMFNWFDGLKVQKPSLQSTAENAAIYLVLKNLYTFHKRDKELLKWYSLKLAQYDIKPSMIYPRIKPYVLFRKFKNAYNSYFSDKKDFLSQQEKIQSLNSKIESLNSSIAQDSEELKKIHSLLSEVDDFTANYIKNFSTVENVILKTPSFNTLDKPSYEKFKSSIESITNLLKGNGGYEHLSALYQIAKKLESNNFVFSSAADSSKYLFDDFTEKYNIIYRRLQEASKFFSQKETLSDSISKREKELNSLKSEYDKEFSQFSKTKAKILSKEKTLNDYYTYTLYEFARETKSIDNLNLVINEISKYSKIDASEILAYKMKLNDFLRLQNSISNLIPTANKMLGEIEEINTDVQSFSKKYKTYFELSKAGINKFDTPYLNKASLTLNTLQNSTIAELNREIKAIDNSFKSLKRPRDLEVLQIKDRLNHTYNRKIKHEFVRWIFNTIIVATISGIIVTVVVAITAYPFSRFRFKGRKSGLISFLIIQMFPTVMAMVAFYNIVRFLGSVFPFVGLNTLGGLILVYLGGIAYNTWLAKGYYDTVPRSLEEAAMIDGATRFQTFWIIVFPLVRPILTVIFIFTFIGAFNDFVMPKILLQDQDLYTYAIGLYQFVTGPYETEWGLFSAASLIGAVPIAVVFMLLQNFLVGGLTRGAVKG